MKVPEISEEAVDLALEKLAQEGVDAMYSVIKGECPEICQFCLDPFIKQDSSGLTKKIGVFTYLAIRNAAMMHPNNLLYADLSVEMDRSPLPPITKEVRMVFLRELQTRPRYDEIVAEILESVSFCEAFLKIFAEGTSHSQSIAKETLAHTYYILSIAFRDAIDLSRLPH